MKSSPILTAEARAVMTRAEQEARSLNHHYVGTEHILLALLHHESGAAARILKSFDVTGEKVRQEIEKLVLRGPAAVSDVELPQTPRAKRAIQMAGEIAGDLQQSLVGSEHVLIGLLRESDGVAGLALRNLGLTLRPIAEEALKIRKSQLKFVERIVRPLRATVARKRKMREELLAHFTAVYEEEKERLNDPLAATEAAEKRFGEPAVLSRELENVLPATERIGYYIERWFGWRAPESALRFTLRSALQSFLVIAIVCALIVFGALISGRWNAGSFHSLITAIALLLLVPADQFLLGLLYFKARDALFGVFGARRSRMNAFGYAMLSAAVVLASGLIFAAAAARDWTSAQQFVYPYAVASLAIGAAILLLARYRGLTEIRDTVWACLPLDEPLAKAPA